MPTKAKGNNSHKVEYVLKAHECFDSVVSNLTKHVRFHTQGKITPKQLLSTIVAMSIERLSIYSINTISDDVSSPTNIKHHLNKRTLVELVDKNLILLTSAILNSIPKDKPYQISMDINEETYFGEITEINEQYVIGGQLKKSTKQFYKYTSVYLTYKNIKITLAVLPMKKKVEMIKYIKTRFEEFLNLLWQAFQRRFKIKRYTITLGVHSSQITGGDDIACIRKPFIAGRK